MILCLLELANVGTGSLMNFFSELQEIGISWDIHKHSLVARFSARSFTVNILMVHDRNDVFSEPIDLVSVHQRLVAIHEACSAKNLCSCPDFFILSTVFMACNYPSIQYIEYALSCSFNSISPIKHR